MIRFARKWLAFAVAWIGHAVREIGQGMIDYAHWLHPEWK